MVMRLSDEDRSKYWSIGIIAPFYLRRSQLDIYELLTKEKRPFIEASRRFGKTTSIITFVFEQLIRNPGWICRWCEPQKDQARKIVMPIIDNLQSGIPANLQAEWTVTDSVYKFPNGSMLFLLGVNEDKGKSARGPASNIVVLDEYGFWSEAKYVSRSILFPQLQNQEGQWFIKASTPPPDLGHIYYKEKEEAIRKERFIQKLIYDNEAITDQEMNEIIEETGGIHTPDFRREYLCEPISNPEMLIVPEWNDEENIVDDDYPRPQWPVFYVSGDSGADDNSALIFGYYDFEKDEEIIEDEIVTNGKTTKDLIEMAKQKENDLWALIKPYRRSYDAPKQLIFDLFGTYDYPVVMAKKDDKHAAIHRFRVRVGMRKFKVKKRCKNLIRQLKVGMWKDEKKQDFQRSGDLGHLDAIAAAIYFSRIIDRSFNPVPLNYGVNHYTHLITPSSVGSGDKNEDALKSIFGSQRGRDENVLGRRKI